jgi:CRP/FNR family transcriptional regulator, cyclic AMP receptor protein
MRLEQAVEENALLSGLPEADRQRLLEGMSPLGLPAGSLIIHQGDAPDAMYLLLEGRMKVYLANEEGRELILDFLEAGDAFGELALLDDEERSASVVTVTPVRLALLPRSHFRACLESSKEMSSALLMLLARRLRRLTAQVGALALSDVYSRVRNVLITESEEDVAGRLLTGELTHQEIADRVGASREMVTRILSDLKKGGYITTHKKQILVEKPLPREW